MSTVESSFRVEYAKSNRSKCKNCSLKIDKDTFRFAIMIYSSKFGGRVPTWYHMNCFFNKVKLIDVNIIKSFDDLRWEDQEKIRQIIQDNSTMPLDGNIPNDSFTVEYAKSNRSKCHGCELLIVKETLRLSRKNYTSKRARCYGPTDDWYHLQCFHQMKKDLGFSGVAQSFVGFVDLNDEDQMKLQDKFGTSTNSKSRKRKREQKQNELINVKQSKIEDESIESLDEQEEIRLKKEQNELLWNYKDILRKDIPHDILKELLELNSQKLVSGESNLIEAVADCMAFGALESCPECNGYLIFNYTNYRCTGNLTEWTNCSYSTQIANRKPFEIPDKIKNKYEFFENYTYTKRNRIMTQIIKKPLLINTTVEISEPDYDCKLPLNSYSLALVGRLSKRKRSLRKQIKELGGTIMKTINKKVDIIISTQDQIQKGDKKLDIAQNFNIHVVSEQFLKDILTDRPSIVMEKLKLSNWGILPHIRKHQTYSTRKIKRKSSNFRSKRFLPDKMTMKLKDGAAVDPDSGLEETCHVLKDSKTSDIFTAVLAWVDITLELFFVVVVVFFKGRTGTTFGSKKIDEFDDETDAINIFQELFLDKTGNEWKNGGKYKKIAKKYYPLEIGYGQHNNINNDQIQKILENNYKIQSNLSPSVQDLIHLIFNVETMKQTLLSFDIDLTKMPLGKLSKNQLNNAYQILTQLQILITNGSSTKTSIIDASNQFYTLIPHDFGLNKAIILDNIDLIQNKTEMIDNLLEIEIAYSMLKTNFDEEKEHPLDIHYKKLKSIIEPIDPISDEFKQIVNYMNNTHASTHKQYKLKLKNLFKIKRENEEENFQKWKNIQNHQLLWHGSRTTNFAGILSQGLRIAPPEVPMTGYMFGKGLYFADMVSKSANYCFTTRESPEGLLLLCEVALGEMYECYQATSLSADKLPQDKQSTKGCGQTIPDPKEHIYTDDGILIPMGHGINANIPQSSLLYNEYIVYNTDQIKIKYLLRVEFDYSD
ncbi:unnamed protein product [Adineta steineri]|uniref:Poly [ADP-ribose] polymerase n=1 Tax=Adineta steineri TaxID=433720 RepID=A0A819JL33_9BILA|nr:unnamed protein product [Adineta steineri]